MCKNIIDRRLFVHFTKKKINIKLFDIEGRYAVFNNYVI